MDDTDSYSYTVPGGGPGGFELGSHREMAVAQHADVPSVPHNALAISNAIEPSKDHSLDRILHQLEPPESWNEERLASFITS